MSAPADFAVLRPPSGARLVDDVYRSLEAAILVGELQPGERLREVAIAQQLRVSRTTIREALLKLERQGLVVSQPRKGTFVARLSRQDGRDIGFSRALLEAFAVRLGFAQLTPALFTKLEAALAEMATCVLPAEMPRLMEIDLRFHRLLVETCGSKRVYELWDSLSGQIRALFFTTLQTDQVSIGYVVEFHQQLVTALRSSDPDLAERAIVQHYVRDPADAAEPTVIPQVIAAVAIRHQQRP